MEKQILFLGKNLFFEEFGNGKPIVLIHGYLESAEIWKGFAERLSEFSRVICLDLPGHGKSETAADCNMEIYADSVNEILIRLKIEKALIVGHSMGGYLALTFAEKYLPKTAGLCLFHSSPFADSDEKRMQREQTSEQIGKGKLGEIINNHVSAVFAEKNVSEFQNEINQNRIAAFNNSVEGIRESLNAMMTRKDNRDMFKNLKIPVLYIFGMHDRFISQEIFDKIQFSENSVIEILENSGHIGFVEEQEKSIEIFSRFIELC
jgi:pimeloyl-ACP methyl ester carboxylesterase